MLLLNKVLPMFFLPLGVVILLLVYAIIRAKRWPVVAALLILYLASIPAVSDRCMGSLESRYPAVAPAQVESADAIVVLGGIWGPPTEDGKLPNWGDAVERLEAGIVLAQLGRAPWLVFTGGHLPWEKRATLEGEKSREQAIARGVPPEKIIVTREVGNTSDEARAVADLMREHHWRRVILVTTAWHMPRAALLFQRARVECVFFPVDFRCDASRSMNLLDFVPSAGALEGTETALREHYGYWFFSLTTRLDFKKTD